MVRSWSSYDSKYTLEAEIKEEGWVTLLRLDGREFHLWAPQKAKVSFQTLCRLVGPEDLW